MEYLLKASAVIAIFYLCYKLFLQRDTFFQFNRLFLLIGLITAFTIPFVIIPIYVEYTPIDLTNFTTDTSTVTKTIEEPFNFIDLIPIIYLLGIIVFSIRFIIQLVSLSRVIIKNKRDKQSHFTIITTTNNILPFSYFKWIVFNPAQFNKEELKQILAHEMVHVKQYHSIDNIITQLACIVLWFNPFIWLYNKDLKQNLEFIADKNAQQKTDCKKSYQYTLLKTYIPTHQSVLSNNFYNSLIKKRIVMLHKSKSKQINLIKYAFIIPILGLFLMSFNTEEVYVEKEIQDTDNTNLNPVETKDIKIIFTKDLTDNELEKIKRKLKKDGINFSYTNLKRNEQKEIISVSTKFENKKGNATWSAYNTKNEPIKAFYFSKTEKEFGVGILEKEIKKTSPWKVSSERNNTVFISKDTLYVNDKSSILEKSANDFDEDPLYILNGKEITKEEFEKINELNINSVSVIKGEHAIKKYGNKGENGVVLIKSKSENSKTTTLKLESNALYIIDGKESSAKELEKIHPNNIKSIDVFKDEIATIKYGDKGKNGVIEITTKRDKWETKFIEGKPFNKVSVTGYGKSSDSINDNRHIRIRSTSTANGNSPLIIVDGKELPHEKLENIKPDNIESMKVLKDKKAIDKYGKKGENGVVEITTKKNNLPRVKSSWKTQIGITSSDNKNHTLHENTIYILDGKESSADILKNLAPEKIENITVLKGESAITKYGNKGKDGVVEITTKK
ncbi:TonB-dependent receptor plug domain-containing protein [Thalassobellus citreus]|uniref:M56 family metallopeptidase n=1 Tax=Thalassobellus citreus TaxID=3367752 RepID=UPI0037887453